MGIQLLREVGRSAKARAPPGLGPMRRSSGLGQRPAYVLGLRHPGLGGARVLRHEQAWRAACAAITPLDAMTSPDYARPITGVMPMGGLMNVDRTGDPCVSGIVEAGDAFCHTDPAFAYACR